MIPRLQDYLRVLNYIWLALVLLAAAIGGWNDPFKDVTEGALGISHSHPDIPHVARVSPSWKHVSDQFPL